MNKILFILSCVILLGCNSKKNDYPTSMDKSIMEKLSVQEMNECLKFDPFMNSIFERINEYSLSYTEIEKAHFYDLTYKRVYSYFKFIEENKELIDKLEKQDKWGEISDMKLNKDTLCNTYFFPKAKEPEPEIIENAVDTTATAF